MKRIVRRENNNTVIWVLRRLFQRFIHVGHGEFWAHQGAFQRSNAFLLAYGMLGMLILAIGVNAVEGNTTLVTALSFCAAPPLIVLIWLHNSPTTSLGPSMVLVFSLMLLGIWLLLGNKNEAFNGSVTWFILFPTLTMFSLGLRLGSLLFGFFTLFLVFILFSPLSSYLVMPLETSMRVRMVLSMIGAFVFSWWAEYIRESTRKALANSIRRLGEEARTDTLTGLGNRRDFNAALEWTIAKSRRDMLPFSLAIIDLDRFKRINDTFGHAVGDKVLLHVSRIISCHLRESDRLFRWGGEEFTILMPGVGQKEAKAAVERIRQVVAKTPCKHEGHSIPCTISIGLYNGITTTDDAEEALVIADKHLYMAKSQGRNQVVH